MSDKVETQMVMAAVSGLTVSVPTAGNRISATFNTNGSFGNNTTSNYTVICTPRRSGAPNPEPPTSTSVVNGAWSMSVSVPPPATDTVYTLVYTVRNNNVMPPVMLPGSEEFNVTIKGMM